MPAGFAGARRASSMLGRFAVARPGQNCRAVAASALRDEAHACVVLDAEGDTASRRESVARLRARTGAPLRDLLHLGLDGGADLEHACVLPRDRATLVQLGGVRAVLGEREALFFGADGRPAVAAAVGRIAGAVRGARAGAAPGEERLPFELVVLEGILGEVAAAYGRRADLYARTVEREISRSCGGGAADAHGTVEGLHRLGAFDGALRGFEGEAGDALRVLEDLLASDEDMVGLLVGERRAAGGAPPDPERHAVVELLLESYHRRLRRVARTLRELRAEVARARDVARVTVDLRRNHIIEFNLHLSMAAVGLAATTSVAGLFGMNLASGYEDAAGGFAAVTLASALLGGGVVAACRARLRRDATVAAQARAASDDRVALAALLENMATLEHLFDATARAGDAGGALARRGGALGRDDLAALVESARGRAPTPREIDMLFDIFDVSGDGEISKEEMSGDRRFVNVDS